MAEKEWLVVLDAGHGGPDPGAIGGGIEEKDLTLNVCIRARPLLERLGISSILTREEDVKVANTKRCSIANKAKADLFIAVHYNAATSKKARGHEVIYAPGSKEGRKLAQDVADAFASFFPGLPQRGIKTDTATGRGPFTVLHKTKMPAVIVECMFISNEEDRSMTDEPHEREKIAEAIAYGVAMHIGLEDAPTNEEKTKEDETMTKEEKETKNAVTSVNEAWDDLVAVFKDGKLEPKEVPVMLGSVIVLLGQLSGLLTVIKVDPKIGAYIAIVVASIESLQKGIEEQMAKIISGWTQLDAVLKDKKVDLNEIVPLMSALSELVEAGVAIVSPYITPEVTASFEALGLKIKKIAEMLKAVSFEKVGDKIEAMVSSVVEKVKKTVGGGRQRRKPAKRPL